ncbi:unnamed protein product [Rotaria sordida]|uniref:Uncharacterized protein n=1 Tax=Rotaria sordida TaxID=392033 RepID=A0A814YGZ0_9BILA|nr:unnamed protein product [Rotaria sordida]CAF3816117.1 unnamed protein product [Rotaria sordida]
MDAELPSPSLEKKQTSTNTSFSIWHILKHPISRLITTILIDVILPLAMYFILQKYTKTVYALVISGVPPILMVIFKAILSRTFDALGFIVFIGFVISAIVAIASQDPIVLLFGQALVTGVICCIFAVTLIPFYRCHHRFQLRPLVYYIYQDLAPIKRTQIGLPESLFRNRQESIKGQYSKHEDESLIPKFSDKQEVSKVYEWIYTNCPSFRRSCYVITSIWSVGLLLGCLGQLILILIHLSVNKIVIYGRIIYISLIVLCVLLTIICGKRERKQRMILIEQWKEDNSNVQ